MITSYQVGAIFMIEDRATGVLESLAEQFAKLDEMATGLQEKLATLGRDSFGALTDSMTRLGSVMENIGREAGGFEDMLTKGAASTTAAFNAASAAADTTVGAFGRATAAANEFQAAAASAFSYMGGAYAGYAAGGGPRGGGGEFDEPFEGPQSLRVHGPGPRLLEGPGGGGGGGGPVPLPLFFQATPGGGGGGAAPPGGGGPGGGGPGGGGGRPGLLHGLAPFIEIFSGYEAIKTAMEESLAIRQALIGIDVDPDSPEGIEATKQMRDLAQTTTPGTIFSKAEAAKAMPAAAPVLGFSGEEGVEKFRRTFPIALRLGELSQMRHKGQLGSEAVAGEEFAHLTDQYEPEGLVKELDIVNAVAKRADTSIARQHSIMKYGIPIAMAAGIDPNQAILEMGATEQILGSTSTVGTGYAQFLLGALHTGGGINAHLAAGTRNAAKQAEHEFEHSLKLQGGEGEAKAHRERMKGSAHDKALQELGVTDAHGKLLDVTTSGGLDEERMKAQIRHYAETHDRQNTVNTLTSAFGIRGERYAEHYTHPDAALREQRYITGATPGPGGAKTVAEEQQSLAHEPMQQFQQMLARLSDVGNTLGNAILPGLGTAAQLAANALEFLDKELTAHPEATKVIGYGLFAALGAELFGDARSVLRSFGIFGAGSASTAANVGRSALGNRVIGGPIGIGMLGYGAYEIEETVTQHVEDFLLGKGHYEHRQEVERSIEPDWWKNLKAKLGFGETTPGTLTTAAHSVAAASTATPASQTPPQQVTIHVGPITMNGVADEGTFTSILHRLSDALKSAMSAASGQGAGNDNSHYLMGGLT